MARHIASVVIMALVASAPTRADARKPPRDEEVARLRGELDSQRKLLLEILALQDQHLRVLAQLAGARAPAALPLPEPAAEAPPAARPEPARPAAAAARPKPEPKETLGAISGRVTVRGGAPGDAWVFVEDIVARADGETAAMAQRGKKFAPASLVVQQGTKVDFPNTDSIFHNVFSVTPGTSFDLGEYRQGDSRSVTLRTPGLVTVFCNIHPDMIGHILVVPGPAFTRVSAEGEFTLGGLPPGRHKIAAWAPGGPIVRQDIDVPADGKTARVELAVKRGAPGAQHLRKDGSPYGSYRE